MHILANVSAPISRVYSTPDKIGKLDLKFIKNEMVFLERSGLLELNFELVDLAASNVLFGLRATDNGGAKLQRKWSRSASKILGAKATHAELEIQINTSSPQKALEFYAKVIENDLHPQIKLEVYQDRFVAYRPEGF